MFNGINIKLVFYMHLSEMLPGIGLFGTSDVVQALVPFLRTKGFRVEAIWGRTLELAENVAKDLNIPFYTNKVRIHFYAE